VCRVEIPEDDEVGTPGQRSLCRLEIPANSEAGIVRYLMQFREKVQGNGEVTITSKSLKEGGFVCREILANPGYMDCFVSQDEPGQWACWDFGEMRVRVHDYAIDGDSLKSWVVEGSLDGSNWTEIDLQQSVEGPKYVHEIRSFRVGDNNDYRFIRLTQTDKNSKDTDVLFLRKVEFFGTLSLSCTVAEQFSLLEIDLDRRVSTLWAEFRGRLEAQRASLSRFECWYPMQKDKSTDGMVSGLHGEVIITSLSAGDDPKDSVENLAWPSSYRLFQSTNEPGQWVCWHFQNWACPTHYTILADGLRSWVLEGQTTLVRARWHAEEEENSDEPTGESWTEIDRRTENSDFRESGGVASFAVSHEVRCCSIRLRQTGKGHDGTDCLHLGFVEFFGTMEKNEGEEEEGM
jgi:hypothetical protein